jgi:signal transduction histidine kinase
VLSDTLSSVKTRSPLQVFAVFAVGIILPGGFLSYLGLRSFQYEGALMRKQTEEQYAAVATLMQKGLSEQMTRWVNALRALARQEAFERLNVPEMIPLVLSPAKLDNLPIETLFVFDEDNRMVVPWSSEPASAAESDTSRTLDWGPWSDEINGLEHLEFVQKDMPEAIKGYTALQGKHLPAPLQAELLKSIAGAYRKLHEYRQAETQYLKLARDYDQLSDISGVSTGILARQLLIALYDENKVWDRAVDIRLDLIEGLILHHWKVAASRQVPFLQELEASVRQMLNTHGAAWADRRNRWERLQALQNRLEHSNPVAEAFAKQMWPDLSQRLRRRGWLEQGGIFELSDSDPEKRVAIVAPLFSPANEHRRGLLVALVRAEAIWPLLERTLADPAQPAGLQIGWDHPSTRLAPMNPAARTLWKATLERQVDGIDPPIHFRLSESNTQEQTRLSRRRLWIYGGMVGLSFIVILVGLVIMRKAVKREMEVANLKADFVANVSHELRTPLTTISYIGERLNLGRYRTDEERKEFYGMLEKETHRLRGLIEDILDFSKMLAGKKVYKQDPLALAPLVQEAHERFDGKAQARGFEVALDLPSEEVSILGDRTALMQAILNLLDNALKYSGQSRKIDVQVRRTADRAVVAVRDYGIGIPDTEKQKIFEKFYRIEHGLARDTEGGVGLGLAMVKHIVEGHRGTIRVESRQGEGSIFSLEFPLNK